MTEMTAFEKFFVNRRGTRTFVRLLSLVRREAHFTVPPHSRILELGAGNGAFSRVLYGAYQPSQIFITDYDEAQVRLARKVLEKNFDPVPPTFVTERADTTHLAYPDGSFDLVVAHMMLHHLGDVTAIEQGAREVYRVLRPGGRFLYVEAFHRSQVRTALTRAGFVVTFGGSRTGRFGWLHRRDTVIMERPGGAVS